MRVFLVSLFLFATITIGMASTDTAVGGEKVKADEIFQELRSVTCESERLADCKAAQSEQLRLQISDWVKEGKSKPWIMSRAASIYGAYILLAPPKQGFSLWLWLSPFAVLGAGALLAWGKASAWVHRPPAPIPIRSELPSNPYRDRIEKELRELKY